MAQVPEDMGAIEVYYYYFFINKNLDKFVCHTGQASSTTGLITGTYIPINLIDSSTFQLIDHNLYTFSLALATI